MITLTSIGSVAVVLGALLTDMILLVGLLVGICKSKTLLTGYDTTSAQLVYIPTCLVIIYVFFTYMADTPGILLLKHFKLFPLV